MGRVCWNGRSGEGDLVRVKMHGKLGGMAAVCVISVIRSRFSKFYTTHEFKSCKIKESYHCYC